MISPSAACSDDGKYWALNDAVPPPDGRDASTAPAEDAAPVADASLPDGEHTEAGPAPADGGLHPCSPATGVALFDFAANNQAFLIRYAEPPALQQQTALVWDGSDGSPCPGSLHVTLPFTTVGQKVQVSTVLPQSDFSGRTMTVLARLDSGMGDRYLGAKAYVKSTSDYVGAYGAWVDLNAIDTWIAVKINISHPDKVMDSTLYDATKIVEVGVDIATGSAGTFSTAGLHIDSFFLQ